MIHVMIADDHVLVRQGYVSLLEQEKDIKVVAQAADTNGALAMVKKHQGDVLLLDLNMPGAGGLAILPVIKSLPNAPKVIVVSFAKRDIHYDTVMKAGADAYREKTDYYSELVKTIREVHAGTYVPDRPRDTKDPIGLSVKESQVFQLLMKGKKPKDIADLLCRSQPVIFTHRKNVLKKFGVETVEELILSPKAKKYLLDEGNYNPNEPGEA